MIDEIKNRISLLDLVTRYGYHIGRNAARYRGGDNPTSLLIEDEHWYDFKTGQGGDVIDFYAVVNKLDLGTAIRKLAEELGIKKKYAPNFNKQAEACHQNLRQEDRQYLHKRGITDETIEALHIGYSENGEFGGRLVFPYWKNGYVVNFIARTRDSNKPKYIKRKNDSLNQNVLWGLNTLGRDADLIIVEGVFDALSAYQDGYKVLSPFGTKFSKNQLADLIKIAENHKGDIVICFDYDPDGETGQKASCDLALKLFQSGIDCKIANIKGRDTKIDMSDLYSQGRSVKEIISEAQDFLSIYIKDISEDELFSLARRKDLSKYKGLIDSDLFKSLQKPPPDALIADEIIMERRLVYSESLGWYEYNSGVWQSRSDTSISSYIDNRLMRFSNGRIIRSILTVLESRCNYDGKFNAFDGFINFKNGMLEITTGKLQSHDPGFMSTVQLNYEYNPDIDCPRWKQFIREVTADDPTREKMLQEMFGYCLTSSTKYQKAFFLVGDGANGKSVLLKVLESMLGDDNVAHVPLTGLLDDFQRAQLINMNVNIVPELHSRLEGINQYLKSIIDGETIQAAHKYRPHIQFKPKCKIICAANEMFTSDDISHGFIRRLIFCTFPNRFEGENRDLTIKDKLVKELPGILNWSLEGLQNLESRGEFTLTSDQDVMLAKFRSFSDNTYDFLEEQGDFKFISRSMLYDLYDAYCHSTGSKPLSARKFYERLRQGNYISEKRIKGIDGFERKHLRMEQLEFNVH